MKRSILGTIGSPLVAVDGPRGATVAAKVESANPAGSAKDRPALEMIRAAERAGELEPGDRVVEPTSGNTGIGVAMVCAARGYDCTIVMPASKSPERRQVMSAYGADLELVEGEIEAARERADEIEHERGAVQLHQFENEANPRAHYRTTAEEIIEQVEGREIDAFVAGVGTGGTLSGNARRLREEFPEMTVVAVEPEENAVLSTGESGEDEFQGMGPGFVSPNLDRSLVDEVETVDIETAEAECRRLAREEGILVGQSSGATNVAAKRVAERIAEPDVDCPPAGDGEPREPLAERDATDGGRVVGADRDAGADCPLVVTVFWDSGERYLSTGLFDDAA
ncbi:PLP-dependent cysteine synthase family protein [Halorubellus sp. JP-L1]|uniref:PLP-dependent cysteine synthase family protein n=1 Tax=Halorubellus sp. JP-L1 TaxID=2715753 RepID=UPI00140D06D8|nr:PLP-dependent cysteine synthase family protein [Halorubellus sp. JP-L1]NHN40289.1 PLP-dependent cysteine synthase family protein [Halorubellus sp. JP-L1]